MTLQPAVVSPLDRPDVVSQGGASAMTDRRQFFAGLATLPMTAAAGHRPPWLPCQLSCPCHAPTPLLARQQPGWLGRRHATHRPGRCLLPGRWGRLATPALLGADQPARRLRPLPPEPDGGPRAVAARGPDRLPGRPATGPVRDRHLPDRRRG